MALGMQQQKAAVLSGYWPLMRNNPALRAQGKNPFQLDSRAPSIPLENYIYQEARYSTLMRSNPEAARELLKLAQDDVNRQWKVYCTQAGIPCSDEGVANHPPSFSAKPNSSKAEHYINWQRKSFDLPTLLTSVCFTLFSLSPSLQSTLILYLFIYRL